ncbi:MAG: AAA family ATPase [Phycisphaeraceae bacterium]|jgi:MoxR-like ATPase|nr:AAA family ATPase [Phycisphaeraceae bacterium]MDP7346963.1 AAA family ATPase [Phycisphaeraceae bacterium]
MSKLGIGSTVKIDETPAAELDAAALQKLGEAHKALREQIARVIVGQSMVIDDILTAIFADGHALMVGVPGLAKTLIVSTIARAIDLKFNRIQFTPDLMPADITGTEVIEQDTSTGQRVFRFVHGPVFANILLADEINRTPPKTQAALLQAMQERQVTSGGQTYDLPSPFFVLATQNPIEQEGTYPLPEAQLDRFMFTLKVGYPSPREELQIVQSNPVQIQQQVQPIMTGEQIVSLQKMVRQVPVSNHVALYCVKLGRSTRPEDAIAPPFVKELVTWGIGPRATQALALAAKARAALRGEYNVTAEHVRLVAPIVLRHRLIPNYHAESQGIDADQLIQRLLDEVNEPTPAEYDELAQG